MRYHHKLTNMICFDSADLKQLFEAPSRKELARETAKSGYSGKEFLQDRSKIQKIVDAVKIVKDNEDVEIFVALYAFLKFYPAAKICFILKDAIDPKREIIDSIEKLKSSLKQNDLTDFGFMTKDGVRAFQLKTYRGKTASDELFGFIKEKLLHYANNIGEVNLLILLQSEGNIEGSFFQNIHESLTKLSIKGSGHILISYNEGNKFDVINSVYPTLGTTRIPHTSFLQKEV